MTTRPDDVLVEETRLGKFQVEVRAGGAAFLADEPAALGGLGSGPNPYDLLGAALGSCTAMTLRLYATQKGWPLDRVRVRVKHQRGTLQTRDSFEREIWLEGALDAAQRQRLFEIAERCPVHKTLERGADIKSTFADGAAPDAPLADGEQHAADMAEACRDR